LPAQSLCFSQSAETIMKIQTQTHPAPGKFQNGQSPAGIRIRSVAVNFIFIFNIKAFENQPPGMCFRESHAIPSLRYFLPAISPFAIAGIQTVKMRELSWRCCMVRTLHKVKAGRIPVAGRRRRFDTPGWMHCRSSSSASAVCIERQVANHRARTSPPKPYSILLTLVEIRNQNQSTLLAYSRLSQIRKILLM